MRFLPLVLTLIMLPVLLGLGQWQLQRMAWKQELLARIAQSQSGPVTKIRSGADLEGLTKAANNYMRLSLTGTWRVDLEQYWFAQVNEAPEGLAASDKVGFHVLTPLQLEDGSLLFVDRGFVPERLRAPSARPENLPTAITGILRWPDARGRFDAADRPQDRTWFVRDPRAMAEAINIPAYDFLVEQAQPQAGWPYAGQSRVVLSNRHLEYALTWFGFAAILVIISATWHIRQFNKARRQGRAAPK